MRLTKQTILQNGLLLVKENTDDPCDRVFIYRQFRFFFTCNGNPYSPADLTDSDADGIPDYIIDILQKLIVAYAILVEALGFRDLLTGGIFHRQGARYIDIYLNDIAVERGLASATVSDSRPNILVNTDFNGKSLKLVLHRGLHAGTVTPIHELLHLFQFSYVPFNNMWFMEGLARWGQRLMQTGNAKMEPLPTTSVALETLFKKWHDAEFFWNRLAALCSIQGYFTMPASLTDCEVHINTKWTDGVFMRVFLQQCENNVAQMLIDQNSRDLPSHGNWSREEKRSANNNRFILKAILEAISIIAPPPHPELNAFVGLITPMVNSNTDDFADPAIQQLMRVLQKFGLGKVCVSPKAILYSDYFDVSTGTLSIQALDFTGQTLSNSDLATFSVVRNIIGNLKLNGNSILTLLTGLDNLESIEGDLTITHTGIKHINGLNMLERVKGKIDISHNPELNSINGFTSLDTVDTLVNITHNTALKTINGFNSLQQINKGALTIEQCIKLSIINGFCNLNQVKNIVLNRLNITQADFLSHLFKQQPNFKGHIKITFCQLENLSCFSHLKSVASSFYLHGNKLNSLNGLENLQTVGASFSLGSNQLTDISQLFNLTKINGILNLSANRLTSLHGLENLKSIKTTQWNNELLTIKFEGNKNTDGSISLTDISALANVQEINKNMILYIDTNHIYTKTPPEKSIYHTNNIKIIKQKPSISNSFLADQSFIQSLPTYKARGKVPILFSNRWQASLKKYDWLSAFCEDIRSPDKIISFCKENNIQLIFANTTWLQHALLKNKDEFRKYDLKFLTNNQLAFDCFNDKGLFYDFMSQNNLLDYMPKHFSSTDAEELTGKTYIIKEKISANSEGVRIILPGEKVSNVNNNSLITEYIEGGEEYASNILFKDGEIVKHISYKKVHGNPVYILSPETRDNMKNERCEPSCMDLFRHILSLANPTGGYCLCCIDYKMVNQIPKIFEINARMGYTLVRHPADFTEMMNVYIEHAYANSLTDAAQKSIP
ncbi:MAG: hypothetical protein EPN17_08795 [Methylobacter sp.]|nr:MAG: hypothetical protein EPN17_08795 [Methylobacter sp.]